MHSLNRMLISLPKQILHSSASLIPLVEFRGGGDSGKDRRSNVDIRSEAAPGACCGSAVPPVPKTVIPRKTVTTPSISSSATYSMDIANIFEGILNSSGLLEKSNLSIKLFRCEGLVVLITTDFWKLWDSFLLEKTRKQV